MSNALKKGWIPLAGVTGLALVGVLWFTVTAPGPEEPSGQAGGYGMNEAPGVIDTLPREESGDDGELEEPPALPPSLEGTQEPDGWRAGPDGAWQVTPALRHLFDYYLTALGEAPLDELVRHIRGALSELPREARQQAEAVLRDYLKYRLEVGDLEKPAGGAGDKPTPDQMAARLASVRDLRRETMGDRVTETFFAREEALNDYALARAHIQADESLSSEEREQHLAEAESVLPESMRQSRQSSRQYREYRESVAELEAGNADPETIDALRAQQFGEEGAEQLAELDQQREDWSRRVSRYRDNLAALRRQDISEQDFQAEREVLRERYFDGEGERTRIRALDRMQQTEEGMN
ncbi:lipase chaperone LimK [Halospina denitrificans]|uniref:Lipase chaperone n=1 Tax=Halospina denitrificans TaxID=332522 RepID=A0A4R7JTU3_9GAMM|nr:lipase secretion chaperone [Halospina denitrificans]TDT40319.1 lipase chaperone LimK [Halospina denitrificans]